MNKKVLIPLITIIVLLLAGVAYLVYSLHEEQKASDDMRELAALEKQEMQNDYEAFAKQYSEMMTQINNDSIVEQLTKEQLRTQQLLEELKRTKNDDLREITRLKKELATVRAVLRGYVLQVDSLNRLNENLRSENDRVRGQYAEATRQIEGLSTERASLSEKVAIAAQLDATQISMQMINKRGKTAKKVKDCRRLAVSFNIARNVTATNGTRTLYVRISTPTGSDLRAGNFQYEDREIAYAMRKTIEYSGEETAVTMYYDVAEYLTAGTYNVSIFADGNMIGSRRVTLN